MSKIITSERGWPGHYILGARCMFTRNTLVEYGEQKVVVSTVGMQLDIHTPPLGTVYEEIAAGRYYETLSFAGALSNIDTVEADVSREVSTKLPWAIAEQFKNVEANIMHEATVVEVSALMEGGSVQLAEELL